MKVGIFNLGISNITSITNVLDSIGVVYNIINKKEDLANISEKYILPGVGNFKAGMQYLEDNQFSNFIVNKIYKDKIPILGICLGMQLFFENSEESLDIKGLSLISGQVKKLRASNDYNLTRVGWEKCDIINDFLGFKKDQFFDGYFVHSYECIANDKSIITMTSGDNKIISAINLNNIIYGCQFHPEKSSKFGIKLIENFLYC